MARSNDVVHGDYNFAGGEMMSPVASLSHVLPSGVDYGKPWIITPTLVVNFVGGLVVSSIVTAVAILADIVGYGMYCLVRQSDVNFQDFSCFSFMSTLGSLIFGVLSFMALMSTSLIVNAIHDNFCARLSLRLLLLSNIVMYMTLRLVEVLFIDNHSHADLVVPSVWSGVLGLSFVIFFGACCYVSGIDSYMAKVCVNLYQSFFDKVDSHIGETTEFYRLGGLQGRVKSCVGHWCAQYRSSTSDALSDSTPNPLIDGGTPTDNGPSSRSVSGSIGNSMA